MLDLNHKKLEVWKMSIVFVSMIYEVTKDFRNQRSMESRAN